jgi:hypothetical protein
MKNDGYQYSFTRFTAAMEDAEDRLTPDEYQALEKENDEAMAESVKADMASGSSEVEAWDLAYLTRAEHVGDVLQWDWLMKNAEGVVGFYRLKSEAFDVSMLVEDADEKNEYAVHVYAARKTAPEDEGELKGLGRLEGARMRIDYGGDDQAATVEVAFEGETAEIVTSDEFKRSGWFGADVIIDGEYLRERK